MVGLIVKGSAVLFLEGPDPGQNAALEIINAYRVGKLGSLSEYGLTVVSRPQALTGLTWKYGFFTLSSRSDMRLAPGPFDSELTGIVKGLEEAQRVTQKPTPEAQGD